MNELEFSNFLESLKRKELNTPAPQVLLNIKKELGILKTEIIPMPFVRWVAAAMIVLLLCNIYVLSSSVNVDIDQAEMLITNYSLYGS